MRLPLFVSEVAQLFYILIRTPILIEHILGMAKNTSGSGCCDGVNLSQTNVRRR